MKIERVDVPTVNLGSLLGDLGNVAGTTPTDPTTPPVATQVADTFGTLSSADQEQVKVRCRDVLANASGYKPNLVALCRMIAAIR